LKIYDFSFTFLLLPLYVFVLEQFENVFKWIVFMQKQSLDFATNNFLSDKSPLGDFCKWEKISVF